MHASLYSDGNVVLLLLNLNPMNTSATLTDHKLAFSTRDIFWLTPPGNANNLQSKYVHVKIIEENGGRSA